MAGFSCSAGQARSQIKLSTPQVAISGQSSVCCIRVIGHSAVWSRVLSWLTLKWRHFSVLVILQVGKQNLCTFQHVFKYEPHWNMTRPCYNETYICGSINKLMRFSFSWYSSGLVHNKRTSNVTSCLATIESFSVYITAILAWLASEL